MPQLPTLAQLKSPFLGQTSLLDERFARGMQYGEWHELPLGDGKSVSRRTSVSSLVCL